VRFTKALELVYREPSHNGLLLRDAADFFDMNTSHREWEMKASGDGRTLSNSRKRKGQAISLPPLTCLVV